MSRSILLAVLAAGCSLPLLAFAAETSRPMSPEELVREALHREVYGDSQSRESLLNRALDKSPDFAPARWALGFVRQNGAWVKPEDASPLNIAARMRDQYKARRQAAADTIQGQLELADWCRQTRMFEQERAHLMRVVEIQPDHTDALLRLGFRPINGAWVSFDEIERTNRDRRERNESLNRWSEQMTAIGKLLASRGGRKRAVAAAQLKAIDDDSAIPAMEAFLSAASEANSLLVVDTLKENQSHRATISLARHAVLSPSGTVRQAASRALRGRSLEGFVPDLLAAMHTPITGRRVAIPTGRGMVIRETLSREGRDQIDEVVIDGRSPAPGPAEVARQNAATNILNERICNALETVTNEDLPSKPQAWWEWWNEYNEVFVDGQKQTVTVRPDEQLARIERFRQIEQMQRMREAAEWARSPDRSLWTRRQDCLAAGTKVWTADGLIAVETIQAGDVVLSQHPDTGELDFKTVLRTTTRPKETLVVIRLGQESIECSGGHPFWVSGEGWVKARELVAGMELHAYGGTARVSDVTTGREVKSYNLIVEEFSTYFVGEARILSHDNTARRPTDALVPGLVAE